MKCKDSCSAACPAGKSHEHEHYGRIIYVCSDLGCCRILASCSGIAPMKKCRMTVVALTLLVSTGAQGFERPAGLDKAIATIRGVGPGGKGSADAARAWLVLAKADADQLTEVLA